MIVALARTQSRFPAQAPVALSRRTILAGAALAVLPAAAHPRAASIRFEVPLVPQATPRGCWAAAIAMIASWDRGHPVSANEVAEASDRLLELDRGLAPMDSELFGLWGMSTEAPQTYTPEGIMDLLRRHGPIWVAAMVSDPHVRVVTGFSHGGDPYAGRVHLNDPLAHGRAFRRGNRGARYTEAFIKFIRRNEELGFSDLGVVSDTAYPVYFAHIARQRSEPR